MEDTEVSNIDKTSTGLEWWKQGIVARPEERF